MKEINKNKILESIGLVYELAENSQLKVELFETIKGEIDFLSKYFKTTDKQTFLLSIIFTLNYKGDFVDLNDLNSYFDSNPLVLLKYSEDFDFLIESGYLIKTPSRHRMRISLANDQLTINSQITEALMSFKEIPKLNNKEIGNIFELIEKTFDLAYNNKDGVSSYAIERIFRNKIEPLDKFNIIENLRMMGCSTIDIICYFYIIWNKLKGVNETNIADCLSYIYGSGSKMVVEVQKYNDEKSKLQKLKFIEKSNTRFMNDLDVKLTDNSKDFLKKYKIKLKKDNKAKRNTIKPKDITSKALYYNETENNQIQSLIALLDDKKLKETRKRLSERKLPKGITTVFYGPPGTGKTESVYQIAKATRREIVKVDISQSKSMWFGESEKITKKIFTDYKELCKKSKRMPILLFNEADALISKRNEASNSSIDKTQNTIQNIFLEELENFNGILIATTNLVGNMDKAFERRFLFKIEIQKPETDIKAMIWKDRLTNLSEQQAHKLARGFNFTGGQIENIVRKKEIEEIITGKKILFEEIVSFCEVELFEKSFTKIGFVA